MKNVSVNEAQQPLRAQYKASPDTAMVTDHARTSGPDASDPFHSIVEPMQGCGVNVPIGVHRALGGLHDAPTPGDMLCAALAACQDSSIRMVANLLGIELEFLQVDVEATVDVRGAMGIEKSVPVGFQNIRCTVQLRAKEGTDPTMLQKLQIGAERCCVVQQTLRNPPPVETVFTTA
ncbi:OsmC family protein [Neptunomonas sp.]|uniref:OsmC family protein n=1 Tax=Neptunomonas sp. TaxID=1971898 RepID=UPI003565F8E6